MHLHPRRSSNLVVVGGRIGIEAYGGGTINQSSHRGVSYQ